MPDYFIGGARKSAGGTREGVGYAREGAGGVREGARVSVREGARGGVREDAIWRSRKLLFPRRLLQVERPKTSLRQERTFPSFSESHGALDKTSVTPRETRGEDPLGEDPLSIMHRITR